MGVLLAILLAQSPVPDIDGPILSNPATMSQLAFFEFAPASGAGIGTACACAAVTGAKGEAMTFTRASSATCTKGNPTTGIANGDLVTCATDQPRVGAPTGGANMLLVEGSRMNSVLRSQELDNAAWLQASLTVALPTVTANYATAPDGTATAERVQIPAIAGVGDYSYVYQSGVCTQGQSATFYLRGVSGSGTFQFWAGTAALGACGTCSYTSDSWSRCSTTGRTGAGAYLILGNDSLYCTSPILAAQDVLIWGAQCEAGAYASSYIPTTSAAVTRSADSAPSFTVAALGPSFSLAASAWWSSSSVGAVDVVSLGTAAPGLAKIGRGTNTAAAFTINATSTTPAVSAMGATLQRGALADNAGTRSAFWQSTSVSAPAASMTGTVTTVTLGVLDGYVGAVCVDPSPTRCLQ